RRAGHVPRPAQSRPGGHERRGPSHLRRADARRREPQRHVPVHRHPGRRHDDVARSDGRQGLHGPGLLPDEPRPDRERGDQPHRPGVPRGLHQGTADGVRHRVQPPREAGDGRVARLTLSTPRPARAPRRALDDLGLPVEAALLHALVAGEPAWLADDRRAAFEAYQALPGESNLLYTPYIDLRAARLEAAAIVTDVDADRVPGTLPPDADGLIEVVEGRVVTLELSEAAHEAGVALRSLLDDVEAVRELLADGGALPAGDRYAQLTRALWTQGVVLDVPAAVRLQRPIIDRR